MEIALTPMEFARRARRLYGDKEAVVDGDKRFTYKEFLERCDRWSSALQAMGVGQGDRVAYIAPNTHSHLEAYYAVPQMGAVLVPINYRLLPEDFAYIIGHSGAKVVCAKAWGSLGTTGPSVTHGQPAGSRPMPGRSSFEAASGSTSVRRASA